MSWLNEDALSNIEFKSVTPLVHIVTNFDGSSFFQMFLILVASVSFVYSTVLIMPDSPTAASGHITVTPMPASTVEEMEWALGVEAWEVVEEATVASATRTPE